jgi:tartrate dehydrogenase/decarboxylase/D-malate dehydrogenase
MLEHLRLPTSAVALRNAVAKVLKDRKAVTPDLGGTAKTVDVAEAVLAMLR